MSALLALGQRGRYRSSAARAAFADPRGYSPEFRRYLASRGVVFGDAGDDGAPGPDAEPSLNMLDALHALPAWPMLSDGEREAIDAYVSSQMAGSDPALVEGFAAQPVDAQLAMLQQTAAAVSLQPPDGGQYGGQPDPGTPDVPDPYDPYAGAGGDGTEENPAAPDSSAAGGGGGAAGGGGSSAAAPSDASLNQATNDANAATQSALAFLSNPTVIAAVQQFPLVGVGGPSPQAAAIQRAMTTAARAEQVGRAAMRTKPAAGRRALAAAAAARAAAAKLSSSSAAGAGPAPSAPRARSAPTSNVTRWAKPTSPHPHVVARPSPAAHRGVHGLQLLGVARGATLGAWYSGSDQAHAGIRAVRSLKEMYDQVVKAHPDAIKYSPQVDPLVADADKWDASLVFYVNNDAVELGRRAQAVSQLIAIEYHQPAPIPDPALTQGIIEKGLDAGGKAVEGAGDFLHYLPWVIGAVALLAAGAVTIPLVVSAVHAARQ